MYSSVFLVVATLSTKYTFTHLQIEKKDRHLYNKHVRTRNSTILMTIAFLVAVEYSERARHPYHRGRSTPCDRWRRCILKPRSTGATRSRIQVYVSVPPTGGSQRIHVIVAWRRAAGHRREFGQLSPQLRHSGVRTGNELYIRRSLAAS